MNRTIGLNAFAKLLCTPFVIVLTVLIFLPNPGSVEAQPLPSPPPYRQLRYEEDYSYLRDPSRRTDLWDVIKYVPFNSTGDWYLSVGGEVRERYEYFDNFNWGQGPQTKGGYLLQRYMLHSDLHLGPNLRFFGQLKSGLEDGRKGGPRPPDQDELDVHQAFLDVSAEVGSIGSFSLRAGRQEMTYGSSRLVSFREGPNVRQSFDGLRLTLDTHAWRVDGFIARPVETNHNIFDDKPDPKRLFWGFYGVAPLSILLGGNIDLYFFGLNRKHAQFNQGTADEQRQSAGTRLWGRMQSWDYNFEFVFQWGKFGRGDIRAWTAASDTGYTFENLPFRPRIGLKADIASGDRDPKDRDLQTFNALFPKGAYFNETDLIGPANFADLHPSLYLHVTERISFDVDWDFFWRQSLDDGIYGIAVNPVRSGLTSRSRYIGSALSSEAEWRVDRHITLTGAYTHFFAGPFLRESGPGKDVNYFSVWGTYKF